jgi:hypothetical protein
MGKLSKTLGQYQEISRKYYQEIMSILEEEYCWKCPMRTNQDETLCREVEAWIRLTEAMESGVQEELEQHHYSLEKLRVISAKFLEKKMKKTELKEDSLIIKLEEDAKPYANSGDFIYVKTHPLKVKKDDLVLMPRACPLATYWYVTTFKKSTVPFKIFKVSRVFQKMGVRHIITEEGFEVPVEYLIGVVKDIIGPDLSMQSWE